MPGDKVNSPLQHLAPRARLVSGLTIRLRTNTEYVLMDWNRIEGNWKQFTGKVKEQWGKLTDDDLTEINGKRDQLEGKIQQRYGYAKDQTRNEVDDWFKRLP